MTDFKFNNKQPPFAPSFNPRFFTSGIFAVATLVVLVAAVMNSWYTIDQGDRGVLLTNGALS